MNNFLLKQAIDEDLRRKERLAIADPQNKYARRKVLSSWGRLPFVSESQKKKLRDKEFGRSYSKEKKHYTRGLKAWNDLPGSKVKLDMLGRLLEKKINKQPVKGLGGTHRLNPKAFRLRRRYDPRRHTGLSTNARSIEKLYGPGYTRDPGVIPKHVYLKSKLKLKLGSGLGNFKDKGYWDKAKKIAKKGIGKFKKLF